MGPGHPGTVEPKRMTGADSAAVRQSVSLSGGQVGEGSGLGGLSGAQCWMDLQTVSCTLGHLLSM